MKIWGGGGLVVYLSDVVIDVMNDFGQNWAASFFFFFLWQLTMDYLVGLPRDISLILSGNWVDFFLGLPGLRCEKQE